jgi:cytochrome-b5 reductase
MDLLIKIYRPNADIKFPHGGKLTPYIEKLEVGDKVHLEGPFGSFGYEGNGKVILSSS